MVMFSTLEYMAGIVLGRLLPLHCSGDKSLILVYLIKRFDKVLWKDNKSRNVGSGLKYTFNLLSERDSFNFFVLETLRHPSRS